MAGHTPTPSAGWASNIWLQLRARATRLHSNPMPILAKDIEALIRETFPDAKITITDLAGDGNHYSAEIVDESFREMNRVQQQRAVYASLRGKMDGANGELHALSLTTKAPE